MSAATDTTIVTATENALTINLSALGGALKELATDPGKALVDGSGQLILKDAALIAKLVGYVPVIGGTAAQASEYIGLAAAAEPVVAETIEGAIALAKAFDIKLPPLTLGDLQHNAGETQAQDVQSSIGIGRR